MVSGKPKLGFWSGFSSLLSGALFLIARPRLGPLALVPAAIAVFLSALFVWLSIEVVQPALAPRISAVVAWLVTLLVAVLGLILALALTPPLASPALERIVFARERELGVPPRQEIGILAEIWCSVRAMIFAALFAVPILSLLWLIDLVFPAAVVVTLPLKYVVVSLSIAWNLFDYPLTLRNVRMRDRFSLIMEHKATCLGFGMAFAIVFWVPCFGVLLLPVGVAAATDLVWRLLAADARLIPTLARAQDKSTAIPS